VHPATFTVNLNDIQGSNCLTSLQVEKVQKEMETESDERMW
jgi:hypothetical protein